MESSFSTFQRFNFEISRAKCSKICGNLISIISIQKSLPYGYNRDLQEITPLLWNSFAELHSILIVLTSINAIIAKIVVIITHVHVIIRAPLTPIFLPKKPDTIDPKSGKIINISSIVGEIGNKGQTNYAASKAGVIGFTKSLAKELASRNINVNVINPGFIRTNMTENIKDELKFLDTIPLKRYGTSLDVANLTCFLASEKSNYITGQTINIDGGLAM